MKIYDVSVTISEQLPVWPGDPVVESTQILSLEKGDDINLTALYLSVHSGTHIDAPLHVLSEGMGVDQLPLDVLIGPCRVLEVSTVSETIEVTDLQKLDLLGVNRVLFKTHGPKKPPNTVSFNPEYISLSREGADWLIRSGIRLVGTDALSIEKFEAPGYPVHHILLENHVIILEGLNLSEVPPGDYRLIALPLKLKDADGAPARVILEELPV